jgi:hypothetical protein
MSGEATGRFLAAYNTLDAVLRERLVQGDKKASHAELINQLAKQDPLVHEVASSPRTAPCARLFAASSRPTTSPASIHMPARR